jgi:hypothetical protein
MIMRCGLAACRRAKASMDEQQFRKGAPTMTAPELLQKAAALKAEAKAREA